MNKIEKQKQRDFIANRLMQTVKELDALPSKQFDYSDLVKRGKVDEQGQACGTVCCVAGWYPAWFPEAKLEWYAELRHSDHSAVSLKATDENPSWDVVERALSKYHRLDDIVIDILFYGGQTTELDDRPELIPNKGLNSSKREVSRVFKEVAKLVREGELDNHIIWCTNEQLTEK